jgi:hypothetical protein
MTDSWIPIIEANYPEFKEWMKSQGYPAPACMDIIYWYKWIEHTQSKQPVVIDSEISDRADD